MNLKFLLNISKKNETNVLIGKNGVLRFKAEFAKQYNFVHNEKWIIGYDKEELPIKNLYILKDDSNKLKSSFQMKLINGTWSMKVSNLIDEINIIIPQRCEIGIFKLEKLDGFKIILQH